MVLDHVGLKVSDLTISTRFYDAAMDALGVERSYLDTETAGYGTPAYLWLHGGVADRSNTHIALVAKSEKDVQAFYDAGLAHGGKDNGGPGERLDYGPHYFAAFLIDPDGNNVEAVFQGDK